MPPSDSYLYAQRRAEEFIRNMPSDPQQTKIALTRLIVGAMIYEFDVHKRSMCLKCKTSQAQRHKGASPP